MMSAFFQRIYQGGDSCLVAVKDTNGLSIPARVRPFSLSGHPPLSVPLDTQNHSPVGLQLVSRKGETNVLCELNRMLSEHIPIHYKNSLEY